MAYFGLNEYIVISLRVTQSGDSFLKIKGIFMTSRKEEIMDYLIGYFTKFLFIIKKESKAFKSLAWCCRTKLRLEAR